jgi:hypothetical protein
VSTTGSFQAVGEPKWDIADFDPQDFDTITNVLEESGGIIDLSRFNAFPKADTSKLVIMQKGIVDSYNTDAEILVLTNGQTLNYIEPNYGDTMALSAGLTVKPIGPRIRITNEVYSINGIPVDDTIIIKPDEDLYVETLLTAKNSGTDISSNTIIKIEPGQYYTVLTDSLDDNCTYSDGILSIDFSDVIPGEKKEQLLPFILELENIPDTVDIRKVIDFSTIDYEGTLVDIVFHFDDPDDVLLDVYDFEAVSISYTDLGNGQVEVSAQAYNKGILSNDVWFRLYPIIGGGAYEFPFAEVKQQEFNPGQTISLKGNYTLPVDDKSIEFIAIIDDSYKYTEVTELNNSIKVSYLPVSVEKLEPVSQKLDVFPVPFTDVVNFRYSLKEKYSNLSIIIYDMDGKALVVTDCPANEGVNSMVWRNSDLKNGNYLYQMIGCKGNTGKHEILFDGKIVKVKK